MAKQKFEVGQVVRLKSGGPEMTVAEVGNLLPLNDSDSIRCQWFGGRKLEDGWFPPVSLVAIEEIGEGWRK